jgi:hypothetical protein
VKPRPIGLYTNSVRGVTPEEFLVDGLAVDPAHSMHVVPRPAFPVVLSIIRSHSLAMRHDGSPSSLALQGLLGWEKIWQCPSEGP